MFPSMSKKLKTMAAPKTEHVQMASKDMPETAFEMLLQQQTASLKAEMAALLRASDKPLSKLEEKLVQAESWN